MSMWARVYSVYQLFAHQICTVRQLVAALFVFFVAFCERMARMESPGNRRRPGNRPIAGTPQAVWMANSIHADCADGLSPLVFRLVPDLQKTRKGQSFRTCKT